jgi:multidrug efflux pump subunit AcrB
MQNQHERFNIVGKVAHFFASNKPLSILAFVAVVTFGIFAFMLTPKQYNPEIVRPAFSITMRYSGATPQQAVDRVVYELVEKISAVPGVDEILRKLKTGRQ